MKINRNKNKIEFLEDCLLINKEILVFSDFHIGYEEYLYGKYIPVRVQLEEILKKLNRIFKLLEEKEIKLKGIIILGDLKHEFGEISDSEWRETLELLDYLLKKCKKIVLIRGNHDNILGPIAKKRNVEVKDFYILGEIGFLHGDKWHKGCDKCRVLVLGHLHPAITLYDNYKKEKYKCFLNGIWKRKDIYILPSFIPLVLGYGIFKFNKERKEKFFIIDDKDLEKFNVIVYNEKEGRDYNFGKLKKLVK